ncbi:MAG: 5'-nucleotidase C-terminal domain-containing protein [Acetivibrio sp.]
MLSFKRGKQQIIAFAMAIMLAVGGLQFGSVSATAAATKVVYTLPIVETSDVHGFLMDVSSGNKDTYQYRMAYISNLVNELRNTYGATATGGALLLDGGDIYQGNPISNLASGAALRAAYDAMGYDAVGLGNHEFDWGIDAVNDDDGTIKGYNLSGTVTGTGITPVVCGNIYEKGTENRIKYATDCAIVTKYLKGTDGTKKEFEVAIFGYVDDYSKDVMAARFAGYEIKEEKLKEMEATAKALEAAGTIDASVLLVHAEAKVVAEKLNQGTAIDAVLGGHTHRSVDGKTANGVAYAQPKNQARAAARIDLTFTVENGKTVVAANALKTVDITKAGPDLYNTPNNTKLDQKIVKISELAYNSVAPILTAELGSITTQITKDPIAGNKQSSTAGTWMTELMNKATGADVSITNAGGIRDEIKFTGESKMVTQGDIYNMAPFDNKLPTFEITYKAFLDIMNYGRTGAGYESTTPYGGKFLDFRIGGATVYYTNDVVDTIEIGDKVVYSNGVWKEKADTKMIVCTNEFIATYTGDKTLGGESPFKALKSREATNGTDPVIDNLSFINALKKEAAANNGKLKVTTTPTIIDRVVEESNPGTPNVIPSVPTPTPTPKPEESKTTGNVEVEVKETVKVKMDTKAVIAKENKDGFFYTEDGKKIADAVVKTEDGKRFILNEKGEKYVSAIVATEKGNKYIVGKTGEVVRGSFVETDGARYYTTKGTGKIVTNKLVKVNGKKYFATKSGELAISKWITVGKVKYYCNKEGVVVKTKKVTKKVTKK